MIALADAPGWLPWIGAVGVTLIASTSSLVAPLRAWLRRTPRLGWAGQLLSCSMCTGFWVGLANGLALYGTRNPALLVWSAGAVSVLSYAADVALARLGDGVDLSDGDGA